MKKTLLFLLTLSGLMALSTSVIREYHYVKMLKTWTEAQSYCREKSTDLATVKNQNDNDRLLSVLQGLGNYAWIGLYDNKTGWKWALGNEDFNNKYKKGPSNYILVKTLMTWHAARTYCRSHYTDLASSRNLSENNQIKSLLKMNTWIGLYRKPWASWSDQSPATFVNWNSNQPNDIGDAVLSCAAVNTTTGMWWDVDCIMKNYFICQNVPRQQQTFKLKFQSEADLKDSAVQQQLLDQLHAKLEKHGFSDFKLRWTQTDGQTFHKEQKKKEKGPVVCQ